MEVPTERGYVFVIIATKALGSRGARALADQLIATPVPQGRQGGRGGLHDPRAGQGSPAAVVKQIVDIPVPQGRRGGGGGLQGFSSQTESSSSGRGADRRYPRLAEVFKVFFQARVPQLPHRVDCLTTQMKDFKGVFALFPQFFFFNAGLGPHSRSELPPESSPSTRRAYAVPMVPGEDESVTESESEVEEDCDLWVDEAWRQWMRTAAFPGRWYLLGTGFDGSIWWDEKS